MIYLSRLLSIGGVTVVSCVLFGYSDTLRLDWVIDRESLFFFFSILFISLRVFIYRGRYIGAEKYQDRFFWLLIFFVAAIIVLTFRANFFSVIIGWDGLGVTSFFLVVYFQRKNSGNAGLITILTNRLGDIFIIISICMMLIYDRWRLLDYRLGGFSLGEIVLLFLVGARFTKRAQVPFSSWLPAAIAAPTPVSSLVHSSTLVTAGVYLLLRFKGCFILYRSVRILIIFLVGRITMCIAGLAGLYENDFKKIVALSTLRQLGLIITSLGLGAYNLRFFHLLVHAYFKALLFIARGSIIHSVSDYQDLRFFSLPQFNSLGTSVVIIISNIRLIGLPFLGGFYSKDLILEFSIIGRSYLGGVILFFVGTILTVIYTMRFIFNSRLGSLKKTALFLHKDYDLLMFRAYDNLIVLAVIGGSLLNWIYLKWLPGLRLRYEIKNFTFLIIFFTIIFIVGRNFLIKISKIFVFKWRFGMIMIGTQITKIFIKLPILKRGGYLDDKVEKYLFKVFFFSLIENSIRKERLRRLNYNYFYIFIGIGLILIFFI